VSSAAQSIPPIDIRPEHWTMVRDILRQHVPEYAVWAFGSRARGSARRYSDLDLAVITDAPMPIPRMAALKAAFSESDLPWRVDIVDWSVTSDRFRRIIERERIPLPLGG
jgi:type I restriction enzyme S subunit